MNTTAKNELLRQLPQVEEILQMPNIKAMSVLLPSNILTMCVRGTINEIRQSILEDKTAVVNTQAIADDACRRALNHLKPSLQRVINATGVIIHTNLGRSALAQNAINAVTDVIWGYSTLEYDTKTMSRGSRNNHIEQLICSLTGAEAALVVNNNAAAALMVLSEFSNGHETIVSRGELVEIGGSFRIPDIMKLSQTHMVEVGTTNKTHQEDYNRAINDDTAILLKVHPSNYRMIGFVENVAIADLQALAKRENVRRKTAAEEMAGLTDKSAKQHTILPLLVYEDQGSGALLALDCFGSYAEPTVSSSLKNGADLVSFSGDKLFGGPQAGIIVGKKDLVDRLKKNPLARAVRIDKMTLAALEATLRIYLNTEEALREIPTLRMLTEPTESVKERAKQLEKALKATLKKHPVNFDVIKETGRAGGGALPMCDIDTSCVSITFHKSCAQDCERFLIQRSAIPIIARIKHEHLLFDARTITEQDIPIIVDGLKTFFDYLEKDEAQQKNT